MSEPEKITEEQPVRLAYLIESAMADCRNDIGRQMDDFDYCMVCPLLAHCVAQEKRNNAKGTHEPN